MFTARYTVEPEIFMRGKLLPISPPALKFLSTNFFSCVNDLCIDNAVTFTAIISANKCFCNRKVAGLGEIFFSSKDFPLYSSPAQWYVAGVIEA